jgi:Ser/Thr protein kinase RdoA (MazF antagonist)
MDLDAAVRQAVTREWGIMHPVVTPHHGGMNSTTWFVQCATGRWVAKTVASEAAADFLAGLQVAARVERAAVVAGGPQPTLDGRLVATVAGRPLALLRWVKGDPLDGNRQRLIGRTLARVHVALAGVTIDGPVRPFHWVDPAAPHLSLRPWLRPVVTAAVRGLDELDPATLTRSFLHTDPAPEAFRFDWRSAECGLIDWSVALRGPQLYDLASAVMYVGGSDRAGELVEAYLGRSGLPRAEVDRGLAPMLRFRWAVQADYFARRIATGDLTGIGSPEDNEKGLEDARRALT